ncbi:ubiquilin-2 [Drosophila albomicans]|uniref:Ubiquilin-2 n=1 Tax=Drosophila albomicans TaxID=7291 RepID=A0A6P8ZC83_DROAB|nr:ubiquilin-2 [Drosophila albomicans]
MCAKSIEITARETGGGTAVVSLRQNELICNLRALVAVRFEQAIDMIMLIFGGQVLLDVGTIDRQGITEGVTVHVLFRPLRQEEKSNSSPDLNLSTKYLSKKRLEMLKNVDFFQPLLDDPATLRDMMYSDGRLRKLLDESASFRHYMSSDRNLREFFSTLFNPAKVQEQGRRRDIHILRMEWVPGSYSVLNKITSFLNSTQEDNVAANYQNIDAGLHSGDNPQRGRENCLPLPNPWLHEPPVVGQPRRPGRMGRGLKRKCHRLIKSDDTKMLRYAKDWSAFDEYFANANSTESNNSDALDPLFDRSLNIFDFMSTNDSRWEQHFRSELLELDALGHTNQQRNISALLMSFGDVKLACKLLQKWNR